jgi:hypothetical protein
MPSGRTITGKELADLCKGRLLAPDATSPCVIRTVSTLADAGADAVSWIAEERYAKSIAASKAAVTLGKLLRRAGFVGDPELAIAARFFPVEP